jgi:isoquinoline 1-oxidoreductase alpha subunit
MNLLNINGRDQQVDVDASTPIWVLRDALGLSGTKFGCARRSAALALST